jgi:hypothetical protein
MKTDEVLSLDCETKDSRTVTITIDDFGEEIVVIDDKNDMIGGFE